MNFLCINKLKKYNINNKYKKIILVTYQILFQYLIFLFLLILSFNRANPCNSHVRSFFIQTKSSVQGWFVYLGISLRNILIKPIQAKPSTPQAVIQELGIM